MKKLLSTILLSFITVISFAQVTRWGVKAGVNFANISNTKADNSSLTGFNGGVILDVTFKHFAIQPGLLFSTKGQVLKNIQVDNNGASISPTNITTKFNYLELPVNFMYKSSDRTPVRFFIGAGPYVAYALSGTSSYSGQKVDLSFSNDYNRLDFGLNAIGGVQLKRRVIISANYGLGLSSIAQRETPTYYNRVVTASVGYLF